MDTSVQQSLQIGIDYLPKLVGGIVVLLVGWLLALLVSRWIRQGVARSGLGHRLARWLGEGESQALNIESRIGQVSYYVLVLLVLVGTFQTLGLMLVAEPLNQFVSTIFSFIPRILGAAGLLLVAWIVAHIVRFLIRKALSIPKFGDQIRQNVGIETKRHEPIITTISDTAYWVVLLLFLPGIVSALNIPGLLGPFSQMSAVVVTYLPHLLAAALIFATGWFLARIIQRILTNLLQAVGLDALGERIRINQTVNHPLSVIVGSIAYVLILIPVLIAALNALQLNYVTAPASRMLAMILIAIPRIFGAVVIVTIAVIVGRFIAQLVANLLTTAGFNQWVNRLGIGVRVDGEGNAPADLIGRLLVIGIVLMSTLEALQLLGFSLLAGLVSEFLVFSGHLLFGLVIIAVGLYVAKLIVETILRSRTAQARTLAIVARVAITALAFAIGFHQMGVANAIINLAFGLTLGSIAIAAAMSFGIGGRGVAQDLLQKWYTHFSNRTE